MIMLVFFLAKCFRTAVKTMVVDKKKTLALLYLASKSLQKAVNLNGVPTEFPTEPTGQIWTFRLNFIAEFFSPKLKFSPSTKKRTDYSFELFFSIKKFVFDFCCLCLFCYNAGQHEISRQKHGIQHRVISSVCHFILVTLWCWRTDVRTDGHVTITSLPKFLGLIGYQISLSNGAPLTSYRADSDKI